MRGSESLRGLWSRDSEGVLRKGGFEGALIQRGSEGVLSERGSDGLREL